MVAAELVQTSLQLNRHLQQDSHPRGLFVPAQGNDPDCKSNPFVLAGPLLDRGSLCANSLSVSDGATGGDYCGDGENVASAASAQRRGACLDASGLSEAMQSASAIELWAPG